jgi:orotate phosphoribosyltransferase-like protein
MTEQLIPGTYVWCKRMGASNFDNKKVGIIRQNVASENGEPMVIVDYVWPTVLDKYKKFVENVKVMTPEEFVLWKLEN